MKFCFVPDDGGEPISGEAEADALKFIEKQIAEQREAMERRLIRDMIETEGWAELRAIGKDRK